MHPLPPSDECVAVPVWHLHHQKDIERMLSRACLTPDLQQQVEAQSRRAPGQCVPEDREAAPQPQQRQRHQVGDASQVGCAACLLIREQSVTCSCHLPHLQITAKHDCTRTRGSAIMQWSTYAH